LKSTENIVSFNPLQTKRRLLYLKTQSVPHWSLWLFTLDVHFGWNVDENSLYTFHFRWITRDEHPKCKM